MGHTPLGWVHPGLALGFEVVSSSLYDGLADRGRVAVVEFDGDGAAEVVAVEDVIADRMGQFASGTAPEMLMQARGLLHLYRDADFDYLERRIREETGGDLGVADLET